MDIQKAIEDIKREISAQTGLDTSEIEITVKFVSLIDGYRDEIMSLLNNNLKTTENDHTNYFS